MSQNEQPILAYLKGRRRIDVAAELGVSPATITRLTDPHRKVVVKKINGKLHYSDAVLWKRGRD